MSSSNLVRLAYKKEVSYGVTPAAVAATALLNLTADITLTSVKKGAGRNTQTFTIQVLAPAANPAATVLAAFTGTEAAIVVTITPNDGTNNAATPVPLTTAELRELISTGAVVGKTITLTDVNSLRILQTATGGGATALADGGEGDGVVGTYSAGSGDFLTARFTSEKYSGTPETTESQQIRTDRLSSGQVVTGLAVDGGHAFELAKETALEDFMESAMFNPWVLTPAVNGNFEIDIDTKKLIRVAGSFVDEGVVKGDFIKLSNFATAANNRIVMVNNVTALELTFNGPVGMVDAASEAATYQVCDKLTIGVTKKSLTVEKSFLDLTTKALIYRGCLVSQMSLEVAYGSLINGSFDTQGNDYDNADAASEFASFNEFITDSATSNSMNGSVDMPFIATDVTGSWDQDAFCLQSLSLNLNNNLTQQVCIGRVAPENYNPGTAQVGAELSAYLKDSNWDLLARKLTQESFGLGFMVENTDGWYGFYIPALQVSFDDPQSQGANQDISLDMTGVAKVGDNGESALAIFREPT
jgi:hypothetical protein